MKMNVKDAHAIIYKEIFTVGNWLINSWGSLSCLSKNKFKFEMVFNKIAGNR